MNEQHVTDNVEMLSTEIGQTIERVLKENDVTDIEIIMALLLNVGDVLINIECVRTAAACIRRTSKSCCRRCCATP
jgi:hypothetical protein